MTDQQREIPCSKCKTKTQQDIKQTNKQTETDHPHETEQERARWRRNVTKN